MADDRAEVSQSAVCCRSWPLHLPLWMGSFRAIAPGGSGASIALTTAARATRKYLLAPARRRPASLAASLAMVPR